MHYFMKANVEAESKVSHFELLVERVYRLFLLLSLSLDVKLVLRAALISSDIVYSRTIQLYTSKNITRVD